jgi:flagellin-like hook-associated protein FlgL
MSIRITDSYLSAILVGDLNRSLVNLLEQQRMAGSLQRVNSYVDDPRAVGTIQRLNSLIVQNNAYLGNVSRSRTLVDGTDIALQDLSEILAEARVLALREASSLANSDTMTNAAFEVENLVGRMLAVLNSSVEGHYLFAGRETDAAPFVLNGGVVSYRGDDGSVNARTGPHSTLPLNIPGTVFMGSQGATLTGNVDLGPFLGQNTLLSDLNQGDGWTPGSLTITAGSTSYLVDLTGSVTVGDILDRINTATRNVVTATLATDGRGITLTGPAPLGVSEYQDGGTALSLGLNTATDAGTLRGADIRPGPGPDTPLSAIGSLAPRLPLGTLAVTWEGGSTTVDLSSAVTLGDVRDLFENQVPGLEMSLSNGYLQIASSSSVSFSVADADGSGTAASLGIAGSGTPVRFFGVMEDLQAALRAGDKAAVQATVTELLELGDTVGGLLVQIGGRQNDLDWAENTLLHRDERLRANLSLERDADVAEVATNLSRAEASYQASLLVTSKLFANNLIAYLR